MISEDASRLVELSCRLSAAFDTNEIVIAAINEIPTNISSAEQIRDSAMELLGDVAAWKLGATILAVRRNLGLPRAFFGTLPASRVLVDGSNLTPDVARLRGVECEFGFKLAREVERGDDLLSDAEFQALFQSVHPAIEVPGTRFQSLGQYGGYGLVADFGAAGALIVGPGRPLGDTTFFESAPVTLDINGSQAVVGNSSVIEGGAFSPLRNFVSNALSCGYKPRAGQIIVTGSCTGYVDVPKGSIVTAHFDALNARVSASF